MASKRDIQKFEKHLLDVIKEDKEQVKMALKSFREFYSDCNTRGMAVIDILTATSGSNTLVFEVEQWGEEKAKNTYDYSLVVVNGDGEVVFDEADGELPLPMVLTRYKDFCQRKLHKFA